MSLHRHGLSKNEDNCCLKMKECHDIDIDCLKMKMTVSKACRQQGKNADDCVKNEDDCCLKMKECHDIEIDCLKMKTTVQK